MSADSLNDICGIQTVMEMNLSTQKLWNKHPHKLPENMTEWNQIQKANRMEKSFPFEIFGYLLFNRQQIGEEIRVGEHYTSWSRGSAARKHNFRKSAGSD
jgi:hypothetical protein